MAGCLANLLGHGPQPRCLNLLCRERFLADGFAARLFAHDQHLLFQGTGMLGLQDRESCPGNAAAIIAEAAAVAARGQWS